MSTTPDGVPASTNAQPAPAGEDAFASQIAAHLGVELEPEEAPAAQNEELPETQDVSGNTDDAGNETDEVEKPAEEVDEEAEQAGDSEGEEQSKSFSTLSELADALEVKVEDLYHLSLPTKIDGKEGETTLRDLLKSYQTDQHLTNKGQKLAEDRKAFEDSRQKAESEVSQRLQSLDTALQLANQRLMGRFSKVDWESLRATNPQQYQQAYIEYQQLYGELASAAQALQQEQARHAETMQKQYEQYVTEQRRLWSEKVPEWADSKVKARELQEMKDYVQTRGIDPADLDRLSDHRYGMVIRDALNWHKLQGQKASVNKKLKDAGPIVRPSIRKPAGAAEKAANDALASKLKKTGKVDDLAKLLRARGT